MKRAPGMAISALAVLVLAGCAAAPALNTYMLAEEPTSTGASTNVADPQPPRAALVIEVARVTVPDYLDSRDLIVRRGEILERSGTGRWASRLSVAATALLTARLATQLPEAWLTDEPPARTPDYRLMIHIDRLDITGGGTGTVEANWEIVPRSASGKIIRRRTSFSMNGAVGTDRGIVDFERALLDRLASQIDVSDLRAAQWPAV
jgi:uncharacterized protein